MLVWVCRSRSSLTIACAFSWLRLVTTSSVFASPAIRRQILAPKLPVPPMTTILFNAILVCRLGLQALRVASAERRLRPVKERSIDGGNYYLEYVFDRAKH